MGVSDEVYVSRLLRDLRLGSIAGVVMKLCLALYLNKWEFYIKGSQVFRQMLTQDYIYIILWCPH